MYAITIKYQKGTSNWMGIWHPEKFYVTSCDFCCMISQEMFEEFVVEELEEELKFLDASIFHLDGPGALKYLDRLLQMEHLKGIQWVYGAGAPPAPEWLDVLEKIQNAGKLIQMDVDAKDLQFMMEHTKPEGVMFKVFTDSIREAKELESMVQKYKRK